MFDFAEQLDVLVGVGPENSAILHTQNFVHNLVWMECHNKFAKLAIFVQTL